MTQSAATPQEAQPRVNPQLAWTAALIVAALGAWIMYDAQPGVNWGIWTAAASVGLAIIARARGTLASPLIVVLAIATMLAAGTAITADPRIDALVCLAVMLFLSLAMLLAVNPDFTRVTALFVIASPFVAGGTALGESFSRFVDLLGTFKSSRARATARGVVITVPIVVFFALLLASADPLFATWRDNLGRILETWSFIPRTIFFTVLLIIVLGAYGFAARSSVSPTVTSPTAKGDVNRWLGATERIILLSSVTALFWLFIAVQLSYLFGNAPAVPGSGITFAEYAQRGFGELSIVATCSALLILVTERYGQVNGYAGKLRALTSALLVAVLIIVASAFYRVSLYENAYGYTVSRLYAQVYMLVLAAALLAVAWGVATTLDTGVLFRRVFAVAIIAFTVLVFWNHEEWIASANIDRYDRIGKLDLLYITRDLSLNAIPVVVSRMQSLREPQRTDLRNALTARYGNSRHLAPGHWFEWNLRREPARTALASIGLPLPVSPPAVVLPAG